MIEKIALGLLSLKSFSSYELRKKLLSKGFTPAEIEPLLDKYQARGYLNDTDLTERRVEAYKKRGYGPHWIAAKLKLQGLRLLSYSRDEQLEILERLLKTAPFAKKEIPKKIAALQRRGFDLDTIFQVIKS